MNDNTLYRNNGNRISLCKPEPYIRLCCRDVTYQICLASSPSFIDTELVSPTWVSPFCQTACKHFENCLLLSNSHVTVIRQIGGRRWFSVAPIVLHKVHYDFERQTCIASTGQSFVALSVRVLDFAKENGAVLLSLPPHTTYSVKRPFMYL
jgi:hypothetical protein